MAEPTLGDTREIVEAMVEALSSGRGERAAARMHSDGVFIGPLGKRIEGKKALTAAFVDYFGRISDYRIEIEGIVTDGLHAMLWGYCSGTVPGVPDGRWRVPTAWRATTNGARLVQEWQVYADTQPLRALLGQVQGNKPPLLQLEPG